MEVLDLQDSSSSCPQLSLPAHNEELITVVDNQGRPLACGGQVGNMVYQFSFDVCFSFGGKEVSNSRACLTYNTDTGAWEDEGVRMNYGREGGSDAIRLSDGRFFITGDRNNGGYWQCHCGYLFIYCMSQASFLLFLEIPILKFMMVPPLRWVLSCHIMFTITAHVRWNQAGFLLVEDSLVLVVMVMVPSL